MPPTINRAMTPAEWGLLLTLAILWGSSYFANAIALTALPPLTIVTVRVVLGALFLCATVRALGSHLPGDGAAWRAFFVMGVLNNVVPFNLIVWGQSHIASGVAAILNATTPLLTVLVAHYFTEDERITPARIAGVIIGLIGVAIMVGPDALLEATSQLAGELACLAAALSYALSVVYGRRFSRMGLPPLATAAGQFVAAAVMMVPLALILDRPWTLAVPAPPVWLALLALAALPTFLAYIIYYRLLATAGSVNLMLVTFLVPITAILLGALVLGERLSANHFLGMAAIGLGLAAIDGRPLALFRRRAA